jgi:mono/diheme cytochrome c family protein
MRAAAAIPAIVLLLATTGPSKADSLSFETIEKGRYLAVVGDCVACHTEPGGQPFAGGLPLPTPFGTIYAPNITPDRETGIGDWTDDEFVATMHEGLGRDGAHLYPAMPYPAYTKATREDALAIRAYLATIAPVKHQVVANQLPFPFGMRFNMRVWNLLNFTPGRFQPDPGKSAQWNRGAYLAQGLAHCGSCHTPKTFLGADKDDRYLQGAVLQDWLAPDITPDSRKGIGAWSEDEIVQYLRTGANAWSIASGPMAEEITNSSSHMTDDDLHAIAAYLKESGAPTSEGSSERVAESDPQFTAGQAIYKDSCAACHLDSGAGAAQLFPRLAGSAIVQSDDPTTLIRMVLQGSRGAGTGDAPTSPAMPALGWRLDDDQVASVVTYIRNAWGNAAPAATSRDVSGLRDRLR